MFTLHRTNVGDFPMKGCSMRSNISILLEDLLVLMFFLLSFIFLLSGGF